MIKLKYAWPRTYEEKRVILPHSHNFYEIVYYIKGSGETKLGKRKYNFGDDSFVLIPPNILHDEAHYGRSSLYVLGFEYSEHVPLYFSDQQHSRILMLLKNIIKEQANKEMLYNKVIEAKIQEIIVLIQREGKTYKQKVYAETIYRSIQFLDEYYHMTKIDLSELAKEAGYCEDRFRILFKKQVGLTPKQYILLKKLEEGKRLLIETSDSVENISNKLGFTYCTRFSAFFKSKTGLYPTDYRKKLCG